MVSSHRSRGIADGRSCRHAQRRSLTREQWTLVILPGRRLRSTWLTGLQRSFTAAARQLAMDPDAAWLCEDVMRTRMKVCFPAELLRQLTDLADRKRLSRSSIVEAAVTSLLSPDAADRIEAAFTIRLDRMSRQVRSSAISLSRPKRSRCSCASGLRSRRNFRQMHKRPPRPREENDFRLMSRY